MTNRTITFCAVNAVDKYCNAHDVPTEPESLRQGVYYYGTPKDLTGADRLGITKAALRGVVAWLDSQEAYGIAIAAAMVGHSLDAECVVESLASHIANSCKNEEV
jgi:hypothetical protein